MRRTLIAVLLIAGLSAVAGAWWRHGALRGIVTETMDWPLLPRAMRPSSPLRPATLAERLAALTPVATARLRPAFQSAGVPFPPAEVRLVAIKAERLLHLYARGRDGPWRLVRTNAVLAASGRLGPKLRQGDHQVPEGIYRVTYLNPNSRFHVSLRLDYPNAFDRRMAGPILAATS